MCNKYIATELMIPNAAADTERTLGAAERYMYIPHVRGLSKSPHRPLTWCILHMQSRPLGSGVHVRSLHCRCIPVLNTFALSATSCISFAWVQTVVACTRFVECILCLSAVVLCRIPASQGRKSVKLGATRTPRRRLRANTLCLKGAQRNARKQWEVASCAPLSPDPCTRFNIYRPG
jgi:hypothetical protein